MTPKFYPLLLECVERGVGNGYTKAHKHTDTPKPEDIWDMQVQYVMNEIGRHFDFPELCK